MKHLHYAILQFSRTLLYWYTEIIFNTHKSIKNAHIYINNNSEMQ